MSEQLFNGDHWKWKSLEDYIAFKEMHDFVNNQQAMETHKNSMTYVVLAPELHEDNTGQKLRNHKADSIIASLDHFASQTLVSLCTTYEVASKDFFKNLFIKHPQFMNDYVGEGKNRGAIKLNDLIESGGYETFIEAISENSSSVASKGKYGDVLIRASKLCKSQVDEGVVKKINSLQAKRNKIVHEKNMTHFSLEDIESAQNLVAQVIEVLCEFGLKKDVPGRYTCIRHEMILEMTSVAVLGNKKA